MSWWWVVDANESRSAKFVQLWLLTRDWMSKGIIWTHLVSTCGVAVVVELARAGGGAPAAAAVHQDQTVKTRVEFNLHSTAKEDDDFQCTCVIVNKY